MKKFVIVACSLIIALALYSLIRYILGLSPGAPFGNDSSNGVDRSGFTEFKVISIICASLYLGFGGSCTKIGVIVEELKITTWNSALMVILCVSICILIDYHISLFLIYKFYLSSTLWGIIGLTWVVGSGVLFLAGLDGDKYYSNLFIWHSIVVFLSSYCEFERRIHRFHLKTKNYLTTSKY